MTFYAINKHAKHYLNSFQQVTDIELDQLWLNLAKVISGHVGSQAEAIPTAKQLEEMSNGTSMIVRDIYPSITLERKMKGLFHLYISGSFSGSQDETTIIIEILEIRDTYDWGQLGILS